jgi:hypothetical protein
MVKETLSLVRQHTAKVSSPQYLQNKHQRLSTKGVSGEGVSATGTRGQITHQCMYKGTNERGEMGVVESVWYANTLQSGALFIDNQSHLKLPGRQEDARTRYGNWSEPHKHISPQGVIHVIPDKQASSWFT